MKLDKINSLISIRQYSKRVLEDGKVKLTREQINQLDNKVLEIDKKLIEEIVNLTIE